MSHFVTLVLVPRRGPPVRGEAERLLVPGEVERLLASFDENLEVPEYEKPCWCLGNEAAEIVSNQADEKFGTWKVQRETFHDTLPEKVSADVLKRHKVWELTEDEDEQIDAFWKEHTAPRREFEDEQVKAHPLYQKADENCGDCDGTGKVSSRSNPKAKWDWHVIGGRWTGALSNYDPEKDPANIEECPYCNGTGLRTDAVGNVARQQDPTYGCNGCSGKGTRVTWPTSWKSHKGDIMPLEEILPKMEADEVYRKKVIPFAIVTPDGEWHQEADMGWWGMTRNKKPVADWRQEALDLLKANKECLAVVVDCHI